MQGFACDKGEKKKKLLKKYAVLLNLVIVPHVMQKSEN